MDNNPITFREVKKFLETAERDDIGYHYMDKDIPRRIVHIYEGRNEANIHIDETGNICHDIIIGKIYFDNNRVTLVPVLRGYANFDNGVKVAIDTNINDISFNAICSKAYGIYASRMKDIFIEMAKRIKE